MTGFRGYNDVAYLGPVGGKAGIQIFQSRHTGLSKDTSLSFQSGLRNVYLFHLRYLSWLPAVNQNVFTFSSEFITNTVTL